MIGASQTSNVAVIGCGYVGYPLALLLVDAGHTVRAIDTDPDVVARITAGGNTNHEPGMSELAERAHATGRLSARATLAPADVFIIAVSTPLDDSGRRADLTAVEEAARSVASVLTPGNLVIIESTVPPGTTEEVVAPLLSDSGLEPGVDFHLAHCPERVFPGNSLEEMRSIARVAGGINDVSTKTAVAFLATFVEGAVTSTTATTAELVKLMENTYRDVNIALANQVAGIAETHGVDPTEAIGIANQHPRVDYLDPGIGVGGHCIPIDPWFLIADTDDGGVIDAARKINDARPEQVADAIVEHLGAGTHTVLLLGAAYKPNVADVRNSPALTIRDGLEAAGIATSVFDPLLPGCTHLTYDYTIAVILVDHARILPVARDLTSRGIHVLDASRGVPRTAAWSND